VAKRGPKIGVSRKIHKLSLKQAHDEYKEARGTSTASPRRKRFQQILVDAYGSGATLQELGTLLGVSRERVRQLLSDADDLFVKRERYPHG